MVNILLWIWCLPQSLIGLIVYMILNIAKLITMHKVEKNINIIYFRSRWFSGCSLGAFIFLNDFPYYDPNDLKHELGHTKQNFMFGWLYLLIIGLPSIILNILSRINKNIAKKYYTLYPEFWADILGGVNRVSRD